MCVTCVYEDGGVHVDRCVTVCVCVCFVDRGVDIDVCYVFFMKMGVYM